MMAGKKLAGNGEAAIREAKINAFVGRAKPTWLNYQRLRLKAKCLCSGREEFQAFSQKYSYGRLEEAREMLGREGPGGAADWFADEWAAFRQDNGNAQAALKMGIRAYRNCGEVGKKELKGMAVGTISRLISRLHSEDVRIGKMMGILHIRSRAFAEAEGWAGTLAEFGCDANRALYEIYESCLAYNTHLSRKLRMELRGIAIRIAPNEEKKERQLKTFQEECGKMD